MIVVLIAVIIGKIGETFLLACFDQFKKKKTILKVHFKENIFFRHNL